MASPKIGLRNPFGISLSKTTLKEEYLVEKYGNKGRKIGEGTYGEVYQYGDQKLGQYGTPVAIKKLSDYTNSQPTAIREMVYQIKLMKHPNITKLLEAIYDIERNRLYMVLELGSLNLKQFVENNRDLDIIKPLLYDITLAMVYLKSKNVMHRDLKPANILIFGENGKSVAKLADFGLTRGKICQNDNKSMTDFVYTLWYRPIEILLGGIYSFSAEVWSLACLFYEVINDGILFPGNDEDDMISRIIQARGSIEEQWPQYVELPGARLVNPANEYDTWENFAKRRELFSRFANLLDKMLTYDPNMRIDIYKVLKDPFFDDIREEKESEIENSKLDDSLKESFYPNKFLPCDIILNKDDGTFIEFKKSDLKRRNEDFIRMVKLGKVLSVSTPVLISAIYILHHYIILKEKKGESLDSLRKSDSFYFLILKISERFLNVSNNIPFDGYSNYLDIEGDILKTLNFKLDTPLIPDYLQLYLKYYPSLQLEELYNQALQIYFTLLPSDYKARTLTLALVKYNCDKLGILWKHETAIYNPSLEKLGFSREEQLRSFNKAFLSIHDILRDD